VHQQIRSWTRLSKQRRQKKLEALGVTPQVLSEVLKLEPRERIIKAATIALGIDQEPNSDLISYIAGYRARAGLYHHFRSMKELLEIAGAGHIAAEFLPIEVKPSELDLTSLVPTSFQNLTVHTEELRVGTEKIMVWQKLNGGMRSVVINRRISRLLFWSGVLLYVTEGTKFSKSSSNVQIANARPGVLRLFLTFIENLGVPREKVRARIQIHNMSEEKAAQEYWNSEIGIPRNQYYKPMLSIPGRSPRRTTFTLHLQFGNSMLCALLSYWGDNLEKLMAEIGHL
jgi:hypothetical protein